MADNEEANVDEVTTTERVRCVLCGHEGGEDFLDTPCHRNPVLHSPWMKGPHECDPIEGG